MSGIPSCLRFVARGLYALLVVPLLFPALAASRPNIVVFLADDAGWGDFSINGNRQLATPNIDSLATGGVTLDRFYVAPVCAPTRAEFLTGRYHPRGGVTGVTSGQERLNPDEKTLADAFQAAGYATGAFGKWHNGSQWPYHPLARGFDEYFGHASGHWGEYFDAPLEHNGRMVRTHGFIVDVCTDRALEFIENHKDQPFFCYIPFTTPHTPWAVPDKDWQRFKHKTITQHATDRRREVADETRCALAMMENQDWNVGRVLEKLDELHLAENTIVVYFSDNGPNRPRWNGGMAGVKGSTREGGVRSPFFIRWPAALPAGHTVAEIAGAIDLLPTLTALAGVPRVGDKPLDGRDLSPLLMKHAVEWPDRMIVSAWRNNISVRTQRYRLDADGRLFDMVVDPGQTAPVTDAAEMAARLSAAAGAWREEMFGTGGMPVRGAVDPRPFQVGYREFPVTMLPARDGQPHGKVRRSSSAPNSSYFVDWTSTDDRIVWHVEVMSAGTYAVSLDYTCPLPDAGSVIEVRFNEARLTGTVAPGWDPPLYTGQDTLPRPPAESPMKEFRALSLGTIELPQGLGSLELRATDIPGKSVMDLRRLTLTLLE